MLYLQIRNCLFDFAHNKDVIPQESFLNPSQVQILKRILPEWHSVLAWFLNP